MNHPFLDHVIAKPDAKGIGIPLVLMNKESLVHKKWNLNGNQMTKILHMSEFYCCWHLALSWDIASVALCSLLTMCLFVYLWKRVSKSMNVWNRYLQLKLTTGDKDTGI